MNRRLSLPLLRKLALVVILASLTLPLWGEVLHHHTDFQVHSDCPMCNTAHAPALVSQEQPHLRAAYVMWEVVPATLFVVFTTQEPLQWSPSNSPPVLIA